VGLPVEVSMSQSRSKIRAVVALSLVAVAGVLVVWASARDVRERSRVNTSELTAAHQLLPAAERAADQIEARHLEVEANVARNNATLMAQRRAFEADGWTFVEVAAPDPALIAASPELLATREAELRAQLLSAPPGEEQLQNVATIATQARDSETRVAAVEALSKMGPGDPQRALVDVMRRLDPAEPARRRLVALLRPASTADPVALDLIALLASPSVSDDEKDQIAMTVALCVLRDGDGLPSRLADEMSPSAQALVDQMIRLAQHEPTLVRNER
jgi:hypothetical protein